MMRSFHATSAWRTVTIVSCLCATFPGETDASQKESTLNTQEPANDPPFAEPKRSGENKDALLEIGRMDLPRALALIGSKYPEEQRRALSFQLIYALSQERLELIAKLPQFRPLEAPAPGLPRLDFDSALQGVCASWLRKDAAAIIRYVEELPKDQFRNQLLDQLAVSLTAADHFADATAILAERDSTDIPMPVLNNIVLGFRGKSDDELFHWVSTLPSRDAPHVLQFLAIRYESKKDLDRLQKLLPYATDSNREIVLNFLGRTAGRVKEGNLRDWADSIQLSAQERIPLLLGVLETAPPDRAQGLFDTLLTSSDSATRTTAVRVYLNRMSSLNRKQVIEWVKTSPADLRPSAIAGLVQAWYREDANALWNWISALDHGKDRDWAIKTYVEMLRKTDPALALARASEIGDAHMRDATMSSFREE